MTIDTFEANKEQYDEIRNKHFYHNTSKENAENILKHGFYFDKSIRGKHYGYGIYFTEEKSTRWGDFAVRVKVNPKKLLYDKEGDIAYSDTPLGKNILEYLDYDYISRESYPSTPEATLERIKQNTVISTQWQRALNKFLSDEGYDSVYTNELGNPIFIARNNSIIQINKEKLFNAGGKIQGGKGYWEVDGFVKCEHCEGGKP